jgi:cytochrome c nitrite reductase small subunit
MPLPSKWLQQLEQTVPATLAIACVGLLVGLMGYTFIYAKGYSYLTNDPAACVNCHIMRDQYDGWIKSTHHSVATCNDCHTPAGAIGKYATKALNGFWHSFYFTSGTFHEPIRINPRNARIANQACLKCHSDLTHDTRLMGAHHRNDSELSCVRCHGSVGHSRQ